MRVKGWIPILLLLLIGVVFVLSPEGLLRIRSIFTFNTKPVVKISMWTHHRHMADCLQVVDRFRFSGKRG